MKKPLIILLIFYFPKVFTQSQASSLIDQTNRLIDRAVVERNLKALDTLYGDDFVFTHGTGLVDSKESWLRTVTDKNTHYLSRTHDSTQVELHDQIAIVTGKLSVERQNTSGKSSYWVKYVRVFAQRKNRWQLISHRTTKEGH